MTTLTKDRLAVLKRLGLGDRVSGLCSADADAIPRGEVLASFDPTTGERIGEVAQASLADYEAAVAGATQVFQRWRMLPAPARGELVRQIGNALRERREDLGRLIAIENGKILAEGIGEIQEAIDIADFAVGLSRQLYGLSMHSERPRHRMYEQWHPLGNIGIITAFNFPAAVWAWNAMIALVCGNTLVWKPSSKTPLISVAVHKIADDVLRAAGWAGVSNMVMGSSRDVGEALIADRRVPLISATGSCRMGRRIGEVVAGRLGRSLLELGGNNGIIVMADADLELATRAILFGAVGTAGQRCTSTRRIFLERPIASDLIARLQRAYLKIKIGDPLDSSVLMGPLIDESAVRDFESALAAVTREGGEIIQGGKRLPRAGFFVEPTIVLAHEKMAIVREETFAPILYVFTVDSYDEAIRIHNSVDQGLSSAIFTSSMKHSERFLSHEGSDCGIANVNIGTSGAEIGGAFGGEKDTGGGREAGSDSWKLYMRRQTCTLNWGDDLPLAQGVSFG